MYLLRSISSKLTQALLLAGLCAAGVSRAQMIDPSYQIRWNTITGSGAPSVTCPSATILQGQPYVDTTNNKNYTCGGSGWFQNSGTGGGGASIGGAVTGGTSGSVLFVAGGNLAQDNANFFYDSTDHWLGIGTNSPTNPLNVLADNPFYSGTSGPTREQMLLRSTATGGSSAQQGVRQTMLGLTTMVSGTETTCGWLGLTSPTFNYGPYSAATYIENNCAGGLVLLSDNATTGTIKLFAGGYTSDNNRVATFYPGAQVGIGLTSGSGNWTPGSGVTLETRGGTNYFTDASGVQTIIFAPNNSGHGIAQIFSSYYSGSSLPLVLGTHPNELTQLTLDTNGGVCVFCGAGFAKANELTLPGSTTGWGSALYLEQTGNAGTASSSYLSIDFDHFSAGLIGQFLSTGSNYSNGSANLAADSIALLAEVNSAQLLLGSIGSSGYVSINAGGFGSGNEMVRVTSSGLNLPHGGYYIGGTAGASCSGTPTSSFVASSGIVTHC